MWDSLAEINRYESLLNGKLEGEEIVLEQDVYFDTICRTCLRKSPVLCSLNNKFEFMEMNFNINEKPLIIFDMVQDVVGSQVDKDINLPQKMCSDCIENLRVSYFYRFQCFRAESVLKKLMKIISENRTNSEYNNTCNYNEIVEEIIDPLEETNIELEKNNSSELNGDIESINPDGRVNIISVENTDSEVENRNGENLIIVEGVEEGEYIESEFIQADNQNDDQNVNNKTSKRKKKSRASPLKMLAMSKCNECDKIFNSNKDIEEHYKTFHKNIKPFECTDCSSRFTKYTTLRRHSRIHRKSEFTTLCSYCGKGFIRGDDLRRHIRIHTNERPYACSYCPKKYKQSSELKEHMLTHTNSNKFTCKFCGKCLNSRNGIYVHMKSHLGIRNHKCSMCSRSFVTSSELQSHVKYNHSDVKSFKCTIENCRKSFKSKVSLNIHLKSHINKRVSNGIRNKSSLLQEAENSTTANVMRT